MISPRILQIFVCCEALAEGLKHNSTLTSLNLYNNNIGPEGAKAWCLVRIVNFKEFLMISPCILQVFVSCEALAEGLKHNSTLTDMDLLFNNIGPAGAQAWCLVRLVKMGRCTTVRIDTQLGCNVYKEIRQSYVLSKRSS